MLTIQDLQKINDLPCEPPNINEQRVGEVKKYISEITEYIDNLKLFSVDYIINMNELFSYWYMLQQNPWLRDRCIVGIMGGYNAGKSTLLNALLNLNLPVGVIPITAIPTYVAYGNDNKHYLVDNDDNIKVIPEDLEQRLSHDEAQGFNLRKLIKNTVLFNNNDLLKKISFLDTPGITVDNRCDYTTTADAAGKCDIVLWVTSARNGAITQFEIEFIQRYLNGKKIYLVLSFADRSPNIIDVRESILKQLENNNIKIEENVFFFGAKGTDAFNLKDQIDALKDKFKVEANGFKQFRPQEMLNQYLKQIQDTLDETIKTDTSEKNNLATQCREFERSIEKIHKSLIDNTNTLQYSINGIQNTIINRCQGVMICSGGAYRELINRRDTLVDSYNKMVDSINEFDVNQMVNYGQTVNSLENITMMLNNYTDARNKCVKFIKEIKSIL